MLWITYAGFCLVGLGCFVLMIGVVDYNDKNSDLKEHQLNVDFCRTLPSSQRDSCEHNAVAGLAYITNALSMSYLTITLGAITVVLGMALFLISYTKPSWFKKIAHESAGND